MREREGRRGGDKSAAGLGHDCNNPKAILQLPCELRTRFIDLLMACEAKLVKPLCLAHMMVLSPSRQAVIAQSVSQSLRFVCSSVYAGRWSKSGRTRASSGAAKARRAIARLGHDRLAAGCGFAVVGPGQVLRTCRARPSLYLKAAVGVLVRFPRRLASTQVCYLSILGLRDHSPRVQWRHHGSQTDVGHSSGNCGINAQALECCRRHFGARCWVPQDGTGPHRRSGQAPGGGPRDATPAAFQGQVLDGTDTIKHAFLRQMKALGIDECDTARNVGVDLQLGRRRRLVARRQGAVGEGRQANETRQAASEGRGTHSQSHDQRLECWGA